MSLLREPDGTPVRRTARQQAEDWWAEVQGRGDEEQLARDVRAGGATGLSAARRLVERFRRSRQSRWPCARHPTLHFAASSSSSRRRSATCVEFLRTQLAPLSGVYVQVQAARGLLARGRAEAVPAMLRAWRDIQPRLPGNRQDAYMEVGGIISLLAESADVRAIDTLRDDMAATPVEVRLAIVEAFLPRPRHGGRSATGPGVMIVVDLPALPAGETGRAVERLLLAALDDRTARIGMTGTYDEISFVDPRVADMAALVLSRRWPATYTFGWDANVTERDGQIDRIRREAVQAPARAQEPPRASAEYGAFAFPNPAGTHLLIVAELTQPERLTEAWCGYRRVTVRFERRQPEGTGAAGRQSPGVFDKVAGSVFIVLDGRIGPDTDACFIASDALRSSGTWLPATPAPQPGACDPDVRQRLASSRNRPVANCWTIASLPAGRRFVLAEFAHQGTSALAALTLIDGDRLWLVDYPATFRGPGQDVWRADDNGVFQPDGHRIVFVRQRGNGWVLGTAWAGFEGRSLAVYVSDDGGRFRNVLVDYWYQAAR